MWQLDNIILSNDIIKESFCCNVEVCKGWCCVEGDSGAPLEEHEATLLDELLTKIKPYMRAEGIKAIEEQGCYIIDNDNDLVTPLIDNKECAYTGFDLNGIAYCTIEKAFLEKKINFQKPISCHLYPIRLKKMGDLIALNYDRWSICKPACTKGNELKLPIYKFLKEPLIRKFGKEWYKELEKAIRSMD